MNHTPQLARSKTLEDRGYTVTSSPHRMWLPARTKIHQKKTVGTAELLHDNSERKHWIIWIQSRTRERVH
ncbi:hypothetical protein LEMLEM_LOCUS23918 [Lemmus lemmus]